MLQFDIQLQEIKATMFICLPYFSKVNVETSRPVDLNLFELAAH